MGINIENTKAARSWFTERPPRSRAPAETLDVATAVIPPYHLRNPGRTGFCIRTYRRCFHPETPQKRLQTPLSQMGQISSALAETDKTLKIPEKLHAIHYNSPVASAQVKSCVLLAGMYSDGITCVTEPVLSRNHTEIMLIILALM